MMQKAIRNKGPRPESYKVNIEGVDGMLLLILGILVKGTPSLEKLLTKKDNCLLLMILRFILVLAIVEIHSLLISNPPQFQLC